MGKRSVESRLADVEASASETRSTAIVSYHPDAEEYRDFRGGVVDPEEYSQVIAMPTSEQVQEAMETGNRWWRTE